MTVSEKIKMLRKQKKITQEELAKIISVERSSIGKYETGTVPSIGVLIRIAKYFEVSLEYLLDGSDQAYAEVANAVQESEERSRQETVSKLQNYLTCDRQEKPTDDGELEEYSEQEKALISAFRRADEEGKLRIIQISMNLADEAEKKSNTANKRNA